MSNGMVNQEPVPAAIADSNLAVVDKWIRWIKDKRLETPATLFLEMHRPLMPLAYSAAMLCGTFVAPFIGPDYYEKIEALRDPAVLDRVLDRLAGRAAGGGQTTLHQDVTK